MHNKLPRYTARSFLEHVVRLILCSMQSALNDTFTLKNKLCVNSTLAENSVDTFLSNEIIYKYHRTMQWQQRSHHTRDTLFPPAKLSQNSATNIRDVKSRISESLKNVCMSVTRIRTILFSSLTFVVAYGKLALGTEIAVSHHPRLATVIHGPACVDL